MGWGRGEEGKGHLAPIPASRREVDLPNSQGFPRRPQSAPPPELASRFGVAGGTRASHPASAHLASLPRTPAFFLSPGPRNRRRRQSEAQCAAARPDSGRCRLRVAGPPPLAMHPSSNPRPTCSLFPHSLSEGRGHSEAVTALQGQRQKLEGERGEQLQERWLMPVETRSSSGEGPATKTQEPVTSFSEFSLLKGASWYI